MKRLFFLLVTVAIILTTACNREEKDDENVVKMAMITTKEGLVRISMAGTGTAVIDWGDKTPNETLTLMSDLTTHSHTYTSPIARTITIIGDNVMYLFCGRNPQNTGDIYNNQLTVIDVSRNTMLKWLQCGNNQLSSLDLSKNMALTWLDCQNNQLSSLDVSKNTALTQLECDNNQLTSLNVSKNTALTWLDCSHNELKNLDVSKNTALTMLSIAFNQFEAEKEGEGLNPLFRTLHSNEGTKTILIRNNPGTATCNSNIAEAKGWTVNTTND